MISISYYGPLRIQSDQYIDLLSNQYISPGLKYYTHLYYIIVETHLYCYSLSLAIFFIEIDANCKIFEFEFGFEFTNSGN